MAQQFKNNARALLVAGISDTDTSFVVESAKADLFPIANTGANPISAAYDWFKVTLQNSSGAVEIVAVRTRTAGSGLMLNVLRGQDGTTPLNFLAGTVVGLRLTADDVQTALNLPNQNNTFIGNNTFSGSNTFSGDTDFGTIPTAPTAVAGTNDNKLATTEYINVAIAAAVSAAKQSLYPVGSIYVNAGIATNPATLLGFGTWVAFGAGRVMVGLNGSDSLFDSLEETGGSKDAIVVSHSHTASSSSSSSFSGNALPSHSHTYNIATDNGYPVPSVLNYPASGTTGSTSAVSAGTPSGTVSTSTSTTVNATGSSGTNANLQPYVTVAMWKRTA